MSDPAQRGTLPTGSVPPASSVPSYLTQTHLTIPADSTESNESFLSQIPLPYHMAEDDSSPPRVNRFPQRATERRESGSPSFKNDSSMVRSQPSSDENMLNPKSTPYVPTGNSPLMTQNPGFDNYAPPGMGRSYPPGPNFAPMQTYPRPYGYGQYQSSAMPPLPPNPNAKTNNTTAEYQGGSQFSQYGIVNRNLPHTANPGPPTTNYTPQYGGGYYGSGNNNSSVPPSYDNSRGSAGMTSYNNYPVPQPHTNFSSCGGCDNNYRHTGSEGSHGHGQETFGSSQSNFPSTPHGSGSASGGAPLGYADGQGFGQRYGDPYPPGEPRNFDNNRYQPKPPTMNYQGENNFAERTSLGYGSGNAEYKRDFGDRHNSFTDHSRQPSQPSMNYGHSYDNPHNPNNNSNNNQNFGTHLSQDAGGRDFGGGRGENHRAGPRNPPFQSIQAPGFGSDKRKTPQLRSRRGQSITGLKIANTENAITLWSAAVPAERGGGLLDSSSRVRSNTKSSALTLATTNENDPFTSPGQPLLRNPFAPTPARLLPTASMMRLDAASAHYKRLTNNGTSLPTLEEALDLKNLPFTEYCRSERPGPENSGVVRIRNIPYSVSRQEIMAFLGRNARLIPEFLHEPIHIVMERVTSKTLDCYVEYVNLNEAVSAVNRFEVNKTGGRGGKIGQRHVDIELSSHDQLMKDLFPKATNVKWANGKPEIIPVDGHDNRWNSGFKGFVSKEELVMLVKHVETPQRSPFSKDCPQRPFECLISTLLKYPWYMVEYITIEDRNLIHEATKSLVTMLVNHVKQNQEDTRLNAALLKRCWRAALACPGFTPSMKDDIVVICDIDANYAMDFGLAHQAADWKYLWTIGPKKGVEYDVLMFYIELIRDVTLQQRPRLSLADRAAQGAGAPSSDKKLFGDLDKWIEYPAYLAYCNLHTISRAEWTAIEKALQRALAPAPQ